MEAVITNIELKKLIKDYAEELGFIKVSFARYDLLSEEIKRYSDWIDKSYNVDMAWMNKSFDKREDVKIILDSAESVIVFAYSYFTNQKHKNEENKISRYAWGDDYHDIILNKLKQVENFIKEKYPGFASKSYVDTGPIMEKQWAVRSGLGWQGKNGLIINKDFGSYFFIGVIINNIPFDNDKLELDRCATCRKCIDACPTGAIISDKVVDANKCISYWTIEAKPDKEIPIEIKKNLKGWSFGCDICQEVCPWNKHNPILTDLIEFYPRNDETNFNEELIFSFNDEEFRARFKNSPIKRTKLKGIQRNLKK